jgi:hypothetical protein
VSDYSRGDGREFQDEKWVPDESLKALAMEADLHPEETEIERAKRLLIENVDIAVAGQVWLARNSSSERIRSDAQRYIIERVRGKAGETPAMGSLDDLFERLDRMNEHAAAMAQSGISPEALGDER